MLQKLVPENIIKAILAGCLLLVAVIVFGLDITIYIVAVLAFGLFAFAISKKEMLSVPFVAFVALFVVLLAGPPILKILGYGYYRRLILVYLGVLIVFFTAYWASGRVIVLKRRGKVIGARERAVKNALGIIVFIIGLIATIYYIAINVDLLFGSNANDGRVTALQGNGLISYIGKLMWLGIFIQYEDKNLIRSRKYFLAVEVVISSLLSLALGFRSALIDAVLVLLFMKNTKQRISSRTICVIGLILLGVVLVYGVARDGHVSIMAVGDKLANELRVNSVNLNNIFETFPSKHPFQMGGTYLINLKMLMPGPDIDFTLWLKEALSLSFSGGGVTPTIVGEFYINWGWFGIVIGMTIFGMLCNILNRYYQASSSCLIPSLLLGYLRSIITGGIANVFLILVMYIVITIAVSKMANVVMKRICR